MDVKFCIEIEINLFWIDTTHGLRMPNEAFFQQYLKLLGLGRQIGQKHFGALEFFSAKLSAPILVLWVFCPCFQIINHYVFQKN